MPSPAEQGVDLVAGAVSPEEADGDGLGAERVDIVGGIGGAARAAPRALVKRRMRTGASREIRAGLP